MKVRKVQHMTILIHSYDYLVMSKRISIFHTDKPKVWFEHMQLTKYHQYQSTGTINRRVNKLDIEINQHIGNDIVIALDSTGIKVANRGEWMRHKWHVRKGYLKIHVAVDIKKKRILSLEVTSEEIHDGNILKKLVDHASENNKVKRVLADGMYDSNNNFRYLSKNHIIPGIKTRSNSKVKSTNCHARNMSVIRQQTNLKRWKRSVSYGYRWMAETVFSCIKRMFGEYVNARRFHNMTKELAIKASLYNMFVAMRM